MNVTALDHLNLNVRNLAASLDFYRRVFGFERREEGTYRGRPWAIVQSGRALLCLYEVSQATDVGTRLNHFALQITDEASWVATLEREGVEVRYGGVVSWPHSRSWYVTAPSGIEVEVALWNSGEPRFG